MEADNLGSFVCVKMAFYGVTNMGAKFFQRFGFGENRLTKRTGNVTALERLFY